MASRISAIKIARLVIACVFIGMMSLSQQAAYAQPTDEALPLQHLVVTVDVGVTIRHALPDGSYSAAAPLSAGQLVTNQDIIRTGIGLAATILCSDNQVDSLISNEERSVCGQATTQNASFTWGGITIQGAIRSANRPYIVSPRNSVILTQRPNFVLSVDPSSTTQYVLELRNFDTLETLWKGAIDSQVINYPLNDSLFANNPSTATRLRYQAILYELDGSGREKIVTDPQGNEGFCIVRGDVRERVEQGIAARKSLPTNVDEIGKRYALAVFYYSQGLYVDARNELLSLLPSETALYEPIDPSTARADSLTHSPMLYVLIARIAYILRIQTESDAAYQHALTLAEALQDDVMIGRIYEEVADIQRGGFPTITADNSEARIRQVYDLYSAAKDAYSRVNDVISVARIDQKLVQPPTITPPVDFCP